MYVVLVSHYVSGNAVKTSPIPHPVGHGEETSPIMLTDDPEKAVDLARHVRGGHEFAFGRISYIAVAQMVREILYIKNPGNCRYGGVRTNPPQQGTDYLLIERPKFNDKVITGFLVEWNEEWISEEFKRRYEDALQERESLRRR